MDENDSELDFFGNFPFQLIIREDVECTMLTEAEKREILCKYGEITTDLDFEVRETGEKIFEGCENKYMDLHEIINPVQIVGENIETTGKKYGGINAILDDEGNTALHIAIREETESTVMELLKNGADANKKNSYLNTSVHEAVIRGKLKLLKLLVEYGGDMNLTGQHGLLPLQMAPISKDENCLDAIIACKPDMNKKNDHGNTTLIHYVNEHHDRMMDILKLLEYGSDPNITNKLGWNCIHIIAADWHQKKVCLMRTLIEYGIDINAELPKTKITPLHIAYCNNKNEFLVHILLQNDAKFTKNWKKMKPFDIMNLGNLSRVMAHGVLREHRCKEMRRTTYLSEISELLFARVFRSCKKELEKLKKKKIDGFPLTYYDFLFCSREESCKLSLNKNFRIQIAKSVEEFSYYLDFIMDKYYQGIRIRRAKIDICFFLSEIFKIPFTCCEEILRFLSTEELLSLHRRLEIS